jgi:Ser/Thr protein kinase RdoA (MazF antagonist)
VLSSLDQDIVLRDPELAGLPIVLDPAAMIKLLSERIPDLGSCSLRCKYLRYKPGTNCLVLYEAIAGDRMFQFYSKAHRYDAPNKRTKPFQTRSTDGPMRMGIQIFHDPPIVVYGFPNDAKLKHLILLEDQSMRRHLLAMLFPSSLPTGDISITTLRYKPERRFAGRIDVNGAPMAALKFYADSEFAAVQMISRAYSNSCGPNSPKIIGLSSRFRVVAREWCEGVVLSEKMGSGFVEPGMLEQVGAALAELHTQRPIGIPKLNPKMEIRRNDLQAEYLSRLFPSMQHRFWSVAKRLSALVSKREFPVRMVHGDFYAEQILLHKNQIIILDLDQTVYSNPARDLGNFVAHAEFSGHKENYAERLIGGYQAMLPMDEDDVNLYTAVGLFHLVPEPFRHRDPNCVEKMEILLNKAEKYLDLIRISSTGSSSASDSAIAQDRFGIDRDRQMDYLSAALDPSEMRSHFNRNLSFAPTSIHKITVTRYKPGRRSLIEYDVDVEKTPGAMERQIWIGKSRAKGLKRQVADLLRSLRNSNWDEASTDHFAVPPLIGVIPELRMYLQLKLSGSSATKLILNQNGKNLVQRIADLIHKFHCTQLDQSNVDAASFRIHTVDDELRILREQLDLVSESLPRLSKRIQKLYEGCVDLARQIPANTETLIHRDFYQDQVFATSDRLYLLDLDLCCLGHPALDAGNFLAHLTEQSLRLFGTPDGLRHCELAFENRFVEKNSESIRKAVHGYALLSLARHISLSRKFPERTHLTEKIVDLCETKLARENELQLSWRNGL